VAVDFELRGCPISKPQLLEVIASFLHGRVPQIEDTSVCVECKRRGTVCVMVAHGTPCLGPITHAGCGALCPFYARGCFGCFGPQETVNHRPLDARWRTLGADPRTLQHVYQTFNTASEPFQEAGRSHEAAHDQG
jgi:hypothetical protein